MRTAQQIQPVRDYLHRFLATGRTIGFVPTMGALHKGHLSLVERARAENDITVVSIFVNPTQFNDPGDFERYPRIPEKDLNLLSGLLRETDLVFLPDAGEIYPEPDTRLFDFGGLDQHMEGAYRPGHFNGVAQVVTRLFSIVKPTRAYFGEKDFQQLSIISYVTRTRQIPVEIVPCPIVREPDGLAMSSRNVLLNPEQRKHAASISSSLFRARDMYPAIPLKEVRERVIDELNRVPGMEVEYFEVVDDQHLIPLTTWKEHTGMVGCVAVRLGKVRLIDNVRFSS